MDSPEITTTEPETQLCKTGELAQTTDSLVTLLKSLDLSAITGENVSAKLEAALERIVQHLNADHGYIMLTGKENQLENTASVFDIKGDSLVTASDALAQQVIETGEMIFLEDTIHSQDFTGDPALQKFSISSVICAPVKTSDHVLGAIYIDSRTPNHWDNYDTDLTEFFGMYIGMAMATFEEKRLAEAGKATLNLSHSVKNILQMVGGAAEVIDFGLRTNQIHRVKRSWEILSTNLERLRKFMLDMLDYSKERKLEPGPCDFNRIIHGAIESLKAQLKHKGSKLNIRVDRTIPTLELDAERIHEMSLNLILNAIDIVDHDTGVVTVSTHYLKNEQAVQLSVADNGPGMSEEMKKKIFTPFESGKNKFGTGLGMPIAKQVVDQHKGRIEIESELEKGATFNVILPAIILNEKPTNI